ncbi:MAG: VWA domain-containing protein, partial [Armatimonadetes bacterium]|nr:VWA domain-containing protein [Armatimonadota bacterium]
MTEWLYRMLGVKPGQDTLQWDRVFLVQPWPLVWLVGGAAAVLLWVSFFYYRDGTRPAWLWKAGMVVFRLAAMAVLVAMICQPMLRSQRTESTPSIVAVVLDESGSMALKDRWRRADRRRDLVQALGDPRAGDLPRSEAMFRLLNRDQGRLFRELSNKHLIRVYRFGADAAGKELALPRPGAQRAANDDGGSASAERLPLAAGKKKDEQTRIGTALEHVLQDTAGQPLAAVLLCSDGGQNMGEDPGAVARRVAEERARIYSLGFGDPQPPQDLAITSLIADEVVRKGDDVVVSVGLRQRGYGNM